MTMYNAEVTVRTKLEIDDLLEVLAGYHPSLSFAGRGQWRATISLPAENLRQAISTALAVVEAGAGGPATAIEVTTSAEFDARMGLKPLPEMVSVTEAATQLGVTRQAVLERLERGTLPGQKVGTTWVIQAGALPVRDGAADPLG